MLVSSNSFSRFSSCRISSSSSHGASVSSRRPTVRIARILLASSGAPTRIRSRPDFCSLFSTRSSSPQPTGSTSVTRENSRRSSAWLSASFWARASCFVLCASSTPEKATLGVAAGRPLSEPGAMVRAGASSQAGGEVSNLRGIGDRQRIELLALPGHLVQVEQHAPRKRRRRAERVVAYRFLEDLLRYRGLAVGEQDCRFLQHRRARQLGRGFGAGRGGDRHAAPLSPQPSPARRPVVWRLRLPAACGYRRPVFLPAAGRWSRTAPRYCRRCRAGWWSRIPASFRIRSRRSSTRWRGRCRAGGWTRVGQRLRGVASPLAV